MDTKKIIIVGASSGIGYETAKIFIKQGWKVGVAARRTELLRQLKAMAPERVYMQELDVTGEYAEQALNKLISELNGMDVYLHVSGIGKQNRILNPDIELDTFRTNVDGFGKLIGCAYRFFAKHGNGHIAVVSSIAGTKGLGSAPAYSATKRFQNTYIQSLAQLSRMEGHNICFTDIRPGFVDTELLSGKQQYPMLMSAEKVALKIFKAIKHRRRTVVIDWRYALLTFFWRLIPDYIWERLTIKTRQKG